MKKKKTNGAEPPVVRHETLAANPYISAALHSHETGEPAQHPDAHKTHGGRDALSTLPRAQPWSGPWPEFAVARPRENCEVYFARYTPGRAEDQWNPIARLDLIDATGAGHQAWQARRFQAPITGEMIASLEAAHGRSFDYAGPSFSAEPFEPDDVVVIKFPASTGQWSGYAKIRGLWLTFQPKTRPLLFFEPQPAPRPYPYPA